jgi:predicted secreted protein
MKRVFFIFVLLFLLVFSAENIITEEVKVDKTRDNLEVFTLPEGSESSIKVNAGEGFFIRIKSNITTGYSWEFAQPVDKDYLEFLGKIDKEEEDDSPGERLLGASGFETLKFKALASGQTVIALKLVRPWEKGVEPIKTRKINVTVE